jgi:hypothetical protein
VTSYVRQGEHVLTISAPTNHIMYYQFTASGSVRKFRRDPYGTVPAATVTVDGEDDLKGCLVHGATNGGADVYAVSGELTYANLSGLGARWGGSGLLRRFGYHDVVRTGHPAVVGHRHRLCPVNDHGRDDLNGGKEYGRL